MKNVVMGTLLAATSVFAVACTSVGATTDTSASTSMQPHHKDGMHKKGMQGPLSQINLTAAQREQIKDIRQKHRNKGQQGREQAKKEVLAVLTPQQRQQLQQMRTERESQGERGGKGRHRHN